MFLAEHIITDCRAMGSKVSPPHIAILEPAPSDVVNLTEKLEDVQLDTREKLSIFPPPV